MISKLFKRRTVWFPTLWGWILILLLVSAPVLLWWFGGESYLSVTSRLPANILVVEGWIGIEGIRAAAVEFNRGGYEFIVTTGGLTGERWMEERWSYAEMAERELLRFGIARVKVVAAPARDTESQRTYESALAVSRALQDRGISPEGINVFTLGVHARRSRLIFGKGLQAKTKVGVVAWKPTNYEALPWWRSSERSGDLVKETAGFLFEALFSSGRSVAPAR